MGSRTPRSVMGEVQLVGDIEHHRGIRLSPSTSRKARQTSHAETENTRKLQDRTSNGGGERCTRA